MLKLLFLNFFSRRYYPFTLVSIMNGGDTRLGNNPGFFENDDVIMIVVKGDRLKHPHICLVNKTLPGLGYDMLNME